MRPGPAGTCYGQTPYMACPSAPESITRLLDMGVAPFNFAGALLGILAQRLAKKLRDCKQPYHLDSREIGDFIREYAEELRPAEA